MKTYLARAHLCAAIATSVGLLAACGPSGSDIVWTVELADDGLKQESENVSVWILRGGCDGTERVYEAVLGASGTGPRPPALPDGTYGFGARAMADDCSPVAYSCVERTLPDGASAPIALVLEEARAAALCPPGLCRGGFCEPRAGVDAGAPNQGAGNCPEGARRPGGACYRYYPLTMTFDTADELCVLWEGRLLVLEGAEEELWVVDTFAPGADFWLGITNRDTAGTWLTVTGAGATFVHWDVDADEPNGSGNCARYHVETDRWRDHPCDNAYGVICKRP